MPTYLARCTKCDFEGDIEKPREAVLPPCPDCSAPLKRIYQPVSVQYAAAGFTSTDDRLRKIVGNDRFARFEAHKNDIEARARRGQLTAYERAMEILA